LDSDTLSHIVGMINKLVIISVKFIVKTFHGGGGGEYAAAQGVAALCDKPEGRGFEARWCH
jgi:hypothetical protein